MVPFGMIPFGTMKMNPFKYGCVVGESWYCARPFLEKELSRLVRGGQNVVIHGERRMGKTSLLHETVRGMRGWRLLYIDLLNIRSVSDFCKRVLSGVRDFHGRASLFEKALRLLPRLRPMVNYDPITRGLGYSFDIKAASDPTAVEEIVDMLAAQARAHKVVVAFDEFQDVLNLPDCQTVLALLRGKIQFQPDIPYVFTGSVRNRMLELFDDPDSVFYKSAIALCVGGIERSAFAEFLVGRFAAGGRKVDTGTVEKVLDAVADVPGDAQELCEALWDVSAARGKVDEADLPKAMEIVYAREGDKFDSFCAELSPVQFKMLVALAVRGGRNVQSAEFLSSAGISNAASARKALNRLAELRHIYKYRGEWRFNGNFFRAWLRRFA